jgi:hypothetical protein
MAIMDREWERIPAGRRIDFGWPETGDEATIDNPHLPLHF